MTSRTAAGDTMLQIAVNAAAGNHDLTAFEPVDDDDGRSNGHQAQCRRCGQSAWVGENGFFAYPRKSKSQWEFLY
jgi:hypothetical protein